jgi:tyrosyl-tRNA synthetase
MAQGSSHILSILRDRGFVQDVSDEAGLHARLEAGPVTLYCGFDATAPSLTIGHLIPTMMLAWFQRCGHRPIALMGGGTTLVGDPSGRQSSRPILTPQEIEANLVPIRAQFERFLDFSEGGALMVNNANWLTRLLFVEFMRDIGTRFSVNEVLRMEAYRTRLEAGGMTFLELSYVLMQSYDFLELYRRYGCILQIGASDQWGNCTAGADLIRRVERAEAFVLVAPLLLTAEGEKMGKTAGNAVWLSSTPYEYYQYWRNTDDRDVERFLATFTFLPMDEVRRLGSLEGAELNRAKEVLAFEATRLLHGEPAARETQEAARAVFAGRESEDMPTVTIDGRRLDEGIPVTELFKESRLVQSANEARNQIKQGGLSVGGERVTDPRAVISRDALQNGYLLLSRGRKRHVRVVCRDEA